MANLASWSSSGQHLFQVARAIEHNGRIFLHATPPEPRHAAYGKDTSRTTSSARQQQLRRQLATLARALPAMRASTASNACSRKQASISAPCQRVSHATHARRPTPLGQGRNKTTSCLVLVVSDVQGPMQVLHSSACSQRVVLSARPPCPTCVTAECASPSVSIAISPTWFCAMLNGASLSASLWARGLLPRLLDQELHIPSKQSRVFHSRIGLARMLVWSLCDIFGAPAAAQGQARASSCQMHLALALLIPRALPIDAQIPTIAARSASCATFALRTKTSRQTTSCPLPSTSCNSASTPCRQSSLSRTPRSAISPQPPCLHSPHHLNCRARAPVHRKLRPSFSGSRPWPCPPLTLAFASHARRSTPTSNNAPKEESNSTDKASSDDSLNQHRALSPRHSRSHHAAPGLQVAGLAQVGGGHQNQAHIARIDRHLYHC